MISVLPEMLPARDHDNLKDVLVHKQGNSSLFLDLPEVPKLACSDILINNIVVYSVTIILSIFPLTGILFSYSQIFSSILRISSAQGKYKAFSTCGSHLLVVSLFYGTGLGVYLSSAASPPLG
ncbi:Olfactory receptor 7C2 [Sciurus carolinensis]|uniref:Olfactory receptor 7C2 n=1 Tax=Sciurus carolinensis TaxID=30640 RepID=A0AA41N7R0_SCICA|nr:Olfactory receptor 7C2 [Sciurus carolinensis]